MQKLFLPLLLLATLALNACEDEVSNIGAPYFSDTIGISTDSFHISGSTPGISVSGYSLPAVPTNKLTHNATAGSGTLFIGKAEGGALESWPVLKFPVIGDTMDRVTSVRLLLKAIPYLHGDQSSLIEDLSVYVEGSGKVTESTTSLLRSDLSANPFATYNLPVVDSSMIEVNITLDTSIKTQLRAASTSIVLVPGAMTNVRAFGSSDVSDAKFKPQLEFTYLDGTTEKKTYRTPSLDMSIVKRVNNHTADQLFIAGGTNDRVLFSVKPDSLNIDRFASINTATLRLKLDPTRSSLGQNVRDTLGPAVVFKSSPSQSDSGASLFAYGVKSATDPNVYEFQLRDVIETWLDRPASNFGFELRAGFAARTVAGSVIFTEDYTLNRWTFFGPNSAEADRPSLFITSSNLK